MYIPFQFICITNMNHMVQSSDKRSNLMVEITYKYKYFFDRGIRSQVRDR